MTVTDILIGLGIWCGASIPVSLVVGRWLRGRRHDPATCKWCREVR